MHGPLECHNPVKLRGKFVCLTEHQTAEAYEDVEVYLYALFTSALDGDDWSASRHVLLKLIRRLILRSFRPRPSHCIDWATCCTVVVLVRLYWARYIIAVGDVLKKPNLFQNISQLKSFERPICHSTLFHNLVMSAYACTFFFCLSLYNYN